MLVFDVESWPEAFNQCGTCSSKVEVYFMRKRVAEQSRKMSYIDQESLVKAQGFEVTPLKERSLFDAVLILKSGTCPDDRNPWTLARTSDTIHFGANVYQSSIGGFDPLEGVHVGRNESVDSTIGVVPGCPATEVFPAIGT